MKRAYFVLSSSCLLALGGCGDPSGESSPAPTSDSGAENPIAHPRGEAAASSETPALPKASGLSGGSPGVWIYTRRYRTNEGGVCTHPPAGPIDATFLHAQSKPLWTFLGDHDSEIIAFTPGDEAEVSGNPIDRERAQLLTALARPDDFQPVFSTNDGDMNFDAGTGGSITLALQGGKVIRPDGRRASGAMGAMSGSESPLDGNEIFIFEDAEFSGFSVELFGPTQTLTVRLADYANDVVPDGFGDDTMTALDLDALGWTDPYVERMRITDDGVTQGARGRCANDEIDTSLELDAVAVRLDVVESKPHAL